jgi:hypothetical protein
VDDAVSQAAQTTFGSAAPGALRTLAEYASADSERVRLAILTLSGGDMERLRHFTQAAIKDFRDVLHWAENPPEPDEPRTYEALRERLRLPPDG